MFTGLVEELGKVQSLSQEGPGVRLTLNAPGVAAKATLGASVAINGCCLTVVAIDNDQLAFEAGQETLSRTNLGELVADDYVNLESSLCVGDSVGGHFVTGHIDGLGKVKSREDDGPWSTIWFDAPRELLQQMAGKGSVAVDGISLTLVEVTNESFSVALIPHTLEVTTLGGRDVGATVNLETDVLAKYVQKQLTA